MPLAKIQQVVGTAVPVPGDDVDTDQIIPARFMKCVTFDGLGRWFFYDVRFHEDGRSKNHPLDDPRYKGATVLIGQRNFGCGSSREHAPQAAAKFGVKAVIAESFAEIFFGNCTTLGIPCVACKKEDLDVLRRSVEAQPQCPVTVDLTALQVRHGELKVPCAIKENTRAALIAGEWDAPAFLLDAREQVKAKAAQLPYFVGR
jgi:3-isopropylmalate/(R)-2-methylmalate dehydratase small subunit